MYNNSTTNTNINNNNNMTSSKMENPLWKKFQNDPTFLKIQQMSALNSNNNNANSFENSQLASLNNEVNSNLFVNSLNPLLLQQQQQQQQQQLQQQHQSISPNNSSSSTNSSISPNSVLNFNSLSQFQMNQLINQNSNNNSIDTAAMQNLNQMIMSSNSNNNANSNGSMINRKNSQNDSNLNNTSNDYINKNGSFLNEINSSSSYGNNNTNATNNKRELGIIEKLNVSSYGFVKCLNRDSRLFFHASSFQNSQNELKLNDLVEFEEAIDNRSRKPIAINIVKYERPLSNSNNNNNISLLNNFDPSLNLMNLKELLLKNNTDSANNMSSGSNGSNTPTPNQFYNNQPNNYNYLMNSLKMLNLQQTLSNNTMKNGQYGAVASASFNNNETSGISSSPAAVNNLNSILNLFNKENLANNSKNNQNVINNNIYNMAKAAVAAQAAATNIDSSMNCLAEMKKNEILGNELMEGTIAIVAFKRPFNNSSYNGNDMSGQASLDGRITYQRSGETFYIPYSLSDVINSNNYQLKIGDRVKFYIAQNANNNMFSQSNMFTGTYYARRVELLMPQQYQQQSKQLFKGIITNLKDSFGKIEREDLIKEYFFHFNEYKGKSPAQELRIGLNVEFEIQDKTGNNQACNIRMLPDGSVNFDELSSSVYVGRIIQAPPSKYNQLQNANMYGRLLFDNNDENLVELTFTERDRIIEAGEYTLLEGDFVQFRIATDKRKRSMLQNQPNFKINLQQLQRATNITLIEEHSLESNSVNTKEHREKGVLVKIYSPPVSNNNDQQQKFGAIKCVEQDEMVFFSFEEIISFVRFSTTPSDKKDAFTIEKTKLEVGDSLEFSVIKCQKDSLFKNGLKAIRVLKLAKNSVKFEIISTETYTGFVEKEAHIANDVSAKTGNDVDNMQGTIRYETSNGIKRITFYVANFDKNNNSNAKNGNAVVDSNRSSSISSSNSSVGSDEEPSSTSKDTEKKSSKQTSYYLDDKIQFNICTCIKTKKQYAVNLKLIESRKETGFITMIKDNYGFIELNRRNLNQKKSESSSASGPRDMFFHFSSVQNASNQDLDVGDEVEFKINRKNKNKLCAENVCKLQQGSIKTLNNSSSTNTLLKGRIIQPLRSHSNNANSNFNFNTNNQDQIDDAYYGKILLINEKKDSDNKKIIYQFGMFGLNDKKNYLQNGDIVTFQVVEKKFAYNINYVQINQQEQSKNQRNNNNNSNNVQNTSNEYKKGKVDSIKGHCGHIEYFSSSTNNANGSGEVKKLFFHISDVISDDSLKTGDEVEFMVSHNPRNNKFSATRIKRISKDTNNKENKDKDTTNAAQNDTDNKRPERLITKLKTANIDKSGKELVLTRQPNNPDGKLKSFSRQLKERLPGSLTPLQTQPINNICVSNVDSTEEDSTMNKTNTDNNQTTHKSLPILDLLMNVQS